MQGDDKPMILFDDDGIPVDAMQPTQLSNKVLKGKTTKTTVGYTTFTRRVYEKLLEAFRDNPGKYAPAARAADVCYATAKIAWNTGWKSRPWARPIKLVLAEEEKITELRTAAIERQATLAAEQDRNSRKEELQQASEEEKQILRMSRADVLQCLVTAAELAPAMRTLGRLVIKKIEEGKIQPGKAMDLITKHTQMVSKAVAAAEQIVRLTREERGQPGTLVGLQAMAEADQFSYEEAIEIIQTGQHLLGEGQQNKKQFDDVILAEFEAEKAAAKRRN